MPSSLWAIITTLSELYCMCSENLAYSEMDIEIMSTIVRQRCEVGLQHDTPKRIQGDETNHFQLLTSVVNFLHLERFDAYLQRQRLWS